jgi:hypothetical protein
VDRNTTDIETRARALFDDSVESIDGATRSRLTQARHAALAELERPRVLAGPWLPAGALAVAAVVAVVLWVGPGGTGDPGQAALAIAPADDFELLAAGEDLDMLDEDVEFYAWAASADGGHGIG